MCKHILLLTLVLVANLAFPRFLYGFCRLMGSEQYPLAGDIAVPTNVVFGPEYGGIKSEQGDLIESEMIVKNTETFLRPKENLAPNAAYSVSTAEGWISFNTGSGADNSSPIVAGAVRAWEDDSTHSFQLQTPFAESECARLGTVHIEIDAIDEIDTPIASLRGVLLSAEGNASLLRKIKTSHAPYLLELDVFTDADELTFLLVDAAGNESAPYTVQIHHLGTGCACSTTEGSDRWLLFLIVVAAFACLRKRRRGSCLG